MHCCLPQFLAILIYQNVSQNLLFISLGKEKTNELRPETKDPRPTDLCYKPGKLTKLNKLCKLSRLYDYQLLLSAYCIVS